MTLFLSKKLPGIREVARPREFDDLVFSMFIAGYTQGLRGFARRGYAKVYAEVCVGYTRPQLEGIRGHFFLSFSCSADSSFH